MKAGLAYLIVALAGLLVPVSPSRALTLNGFDLHGALVPPEQILHCGPAKDGIPAINAPKFIPAGAAISRVATACSASPATAR